MLKEENFAEKSLVVGDIKVLGKASGASFDKIKESMELMQMSLNTLNVKQDDYWSGLSADGVISFVEKKQLKKEWQTIDQVHTALMENARAKGVENTKEVIAYDLRYEELHEYLFIILKLFDNMGEDTKIESSEVFNGYYTRYYHDLQNAQGRVNIGDPGSIRELSSLLDLGTDGEVALYDNNFYRYDLENHEWIGISVASKLGEYMGVLTESPPQVLNQYFLVGPQGIQTDFLIFNVEGRAAEDNAWVDENGEIIYINNGYEAGYIYYWSENNEFVKVEDKNNWRYIIALNDMIDCGFDISPELMAFLRRTIIDEVDQVKEEMATFIPSYLGKRTSVPENPNDGDWFTWATTSTSRFTKGHVYYYEKATVRWMELDTTRDDGKSQSMVMEALTDILTVNPTEVGYFSTIFAAAFYGNFAVLNKLSATQIELEPTGYIKSKGHVAGRVGWIINGDGKAEFASVRIVSGYASDEDLRRAEQKAEDAGTAAGNAQGTANEAKTAAGNAQAAAEAAGTAAGTAQATAETAGIAAGNAQTTANAANEAIGTINNVTLPSMNKAIKDNKDTASFLKTVQDQIVKHDPDGSNAKYVGAILQDVSDPRHYAFFTDGFDPEKNKGFAVTQDGRVYALDAVIRGGVYASYGEFTGYVHATDGIFEGTVYADAGSFTDCRIQNCYGSFRFQLFPGYSYNFLSITEAENFVASGSNDSFLRRTYKMPVSGNVFFDLELSQLGLFSGRGLHLMVIRNNNTVLLEAEWMNPDQYEYSKNHVNADGSYTIEEGTLTVEVRQLAAGGMAKIKINHFNVKVAEDPGILKYLSDFTDNTGRWTPS